MAIITIDGSKGGGQLLRSALTLSMLTGQKFRIINIRAIRPKPGLQRQHLVCVQASEKISNAAVDGAELGSTELIFSPGKIAAGDYEFPIGSAGSTTLVLQTILLPLAVGGKTASKVRIIGGTHNPLAPPTEFLEHCFLPALAKMGVSAQLQLTKPGFFPAGGGIIDTEITPSTNWETLDLTQFTDDSAPEAEPGISLSATIYAAHLKPDVATREIASLNKELRLPLAESNIINPKSDGPGNVILLEARSNAGWREVVTQCGEIKRSAESVAASAAKGMNKFLSLQAPVGMHLQDQLQIPLTLAGKGTFITGPLRDHFVSNQEVVQAFLGKAPKSEELGQGRVRVYL